MFSVPAGLNAKVGVTNSGKVRACQRACMGMCVRACVCAVLAQNSAIAEG